MSFGKKAAGYLKKVSAAITAAVIFAGLTPATYADDESAAEISASAAILYEATTGSVILEKESETSMPMGHFAKLMTVYLAAEKIESGELSLEDSFCASKKANAQTGTVIWLDAGEEITVGELLKSVIIGNANDGCVTLGEGMYGGEEEYMSAANQAAVELEMKATHFADMTGMDSKTVSCAKDVAIICGRLLRYDFLREYFVTWIDEVRGGKTQLVNTNRLVKSYNGITGMKACALEATGSCLAATAKRDKMELVAVIMGSSGMDERFSQAREYLDYGFAGYEIYEPEPLPESMEKITVRHGVCQKVEVDAGSAPLMLIPKGSAANVSVLVEREEYLEAPVRKGDKVGYVKYANDDGVLFETKLLAKNDVEKISWSFALKTLLLNLLKLG